MSDAAEAKTTAAGRANSAQPDPAPAAAAAPCECADRLDRLEGRWAAQDTLNRAMSWCLLACAAAVLYMAWTGGGSGSKDTAAK